MEFQCDETAKKKISALELGSKLGIIGNQTDVSQLIHNSLRPPAAGESLSKTVKEWQQELLAYLKIVSPTPTVSKSSFRDARKLFGENLKKKVTLRKSGHLGAYEEISLLQFDPNFTSSEVICRHPSCSINNSEAAKIGSKRDLFLCTTHQQALRENISDLLAKKEIELSTSTKKPEHGHFAGYTSLIGLLEGAYHDAKKFQTLRGKSPLIQEAILNVRNFLIITNCLLNPNGDNLEIALPPVVQILRLILQNPDATNQLGVGLIYILREVIEMILFSFGVIYTWVALALSNPGAQIGFGVGAILGASAFFLGPWSGAPGVAIVGTAGGLIGNGVHGLITGGQRHQELQQFRQRWMEAGGDIPGSGRPNNQYQVYYFEGDVAGGLDLFPADL
ncbi:uncharacterized protein LOC111340838 [Stylophora pistillata]|nr:uncharacterized protein LOC111340838 [Stylophora pistillata]